MKLLDALRKLFRRHHPPAINPTPPAIPATVATPAPPMFLAPTVKPVPMVKPAPVIKPPALKAAPAFVMPEVEPAPDAAPEKMKMGESRYTYHATELSAPVVNVPEAVCVYWSTNIRYESDYDPERETGVVLYLNSANKIFGAMRVQGDWDSVLLEKWPILEKAMQTGATSVIMSHSHPKGGSVAPSNADVEVAQMFRRYLRAGNVELLDSVIVGSEGVYFSMRDSPLWAVVTLGSTMFR